MQTCQGCCQTAREAYTRRCQAAQNILNENQLQDQINPNIPSANAGGPRINMQPTVEDVDNEDEPANQKQNNVNDNVPVNPLQESAVSAEEKQQLQVVRQKIMEIKMEHCVYCKEKWFDIKLKDGKCSKCQKNQKFQAINKMDPGIIPQALPQLTQIEEIIIAPIHALVQLWQVQGGQYKHTSHICNFP